MESKYRTTTALVLIFVFLLSCPLMAGEGGGGETGEDGDSNAMTYITIGLVVVVGGLFFLDILAGPSGEAVIADTVPDQIIETGINWDEAFPEEELITLAVSVFPGEEGSGNTVLFINVLNDLAGDNIAVYNDPLDLGTDSAVQQATMAHEYFGVNYLIFQLEDSETLRYGIASPDSVLWTSTDQSDNSMLVIAENVLQSGVF
ncbi:hypothetical protein DRQ25_02495 [Candidatus Fermentibacteria bacterium]|nr:MAG: hypothetical protein DRQ25_02495 [Candidatus Fermentibacteria bacterium]